MCDLAGESCGSNPPSPRRGADARARHRRDVGGVQPGARRAADAATLSRSRAARPHSACADRWAASSAAAMVGRAVDGMAARVEVVRGDRRVPLVVQLPGLDEGSESLEGMFVSKDYFRVLGLEPAARSDVLRRPKPLPAGSGHHPRLRRLAAEVRRRSQHRRHDRSASAAGETPPTVIGVMPPGIRFLPSPTTAQEPNYNVNAQVDFWMPVAPNPERLKQPIWDVVGRLRGGATIDQARAELDGAHRETGQGGPGLRRDHAAGTGAHRQLQSRRRAHPAAAVRRGRAGAADRVRQRRRAAARARPAASGRVRRPHARSASDDSRCFVRSRSKACCSRCSAARSASASRSGSSRSSS